MPDSARSSVSTSASVASSVSAVTIAGAAGMARRGVAIFNDSTANLFILLGGTGTVSASNFTCKMAAGTYYEAPYGFGGVVTGIWDVANGNARVTVFN